MSSNGDPTSALNGHADVPDVVVDLTQDELVFVSASVEGEGEGELEKAIGCIEDVVVGDEFQALQVNLSSCYFP